MKSVQVSSLGFDLNKSVPETVAEYDSLAKREGACLDDAVNSTLYRGTFAEFRNLFLHGRDAEGDQPAFEGVEQLTGIKRHTKTVKNAKGEESEAWDETEGEYWKRVVAQNFGGDADAAVNHFQSVAQSAMDIAAFDPSVKERKSAGPKTVAKTYTKLATQAVETGKGEKLASMLSGVLNRAINLTGDNAKDIEILARAISDNEARKRKESEAEYAV